MLPLPSPLLRVADQRLHLRPHHLPNDLPTDPARLDSPFSIRNLATRCSPEQPSSGESHDRDHQPLPPTPPRPAVDDHVVPEGARWELLDGERIQIPPAEEPHAALHLALGYVLRAHVAEGFAVAFYMLTRTSEDTDIAPSVSIYAPSSHGRFPR